MYELITQYAPRRCYDSYLRWLVISKELLVPLVLEFESVCEFLVPDGVRECLYSMSL